MFGRQLRYLGDTDLSHNLLLSGHHRLCFPQPQTTGCAVPQASSTGGQRSTPIREVYVENLTVREELVDLACSNEFQHPQLPPC